MPTLEWTGKDKVMNHHQNVPFRVLERSYSFDAAGHHEKDNGSENMIIHGDNLEALKALLPRYEGRVKCIYIDPPYNTGNEGWCYNDNVNDPKMKKWLGEVVGKEGEDLSRHDKWLCMIYPRLKLLHKLLADDGIIFISIDDNEQANLKLACDEIFGKNNLLAQLIWKSDGNFDNQAKIKVCHEYILSYFKNISRMGLPNGFDPTTNKNSKIFNKEIRNTIVKNGHKNPMSEIVLPIGFPSSVEDNTIHARSNMYPHYLSNAIIKNYKLTNNVTVFSGWSSKKILENFISNKFDPVLDNKGQKTIFEITSSGAIEMVKTREYISHVLSILNGLGSTQNMSNELQHANIKFDFPKPVTLIEYLFKFYSDKDSIILDSFAGSGTTAHAVLNMNKQDGGNRTFILVEMEDYADTTTAERVKRVISGYGEGKNAVEGTGGGFSFYELGEPLLLDAEHLNEAVGVEKIREYVWFMETKRPFVSVPNDNPFYLGSNNHVDYYFYYEPETVTVLDYDFLTTLSGKADGTVIYADRCALSEEQLTDLNIVFKKIPRDIARL